MEPRKFEIQQLNGMHKDNWLTLEKFETEEEARLAIADSNRYPLTKSLRIIQVL